MTIYSYTKHIDNITTKTLNAPEGSTELCTIEGVTYVTIPDGETLPEGQPQQIADSIEEVVVTDGGTCCQSLALSSLVKG